jgi:uncharacterized protein (DUF4213/DUF364 family)
MMKLIDDLIAAGKENVAPVRDARVGISWTGVWGKNCGLSKTYGIPFVHGNYTRDMGHLTEKTTLELAEYARSWNLVEASLGVAAINSMLVPKKTIDANAQEIILAKAEGKRVAVTGAFPFTPQLKKIARQVWVLELEPSFINPAQGIITETAAEYVIPDSDIFILTGSTLINKSMERLLELARMAKTYTVVLGPSTPLSEVLFDYGVSMIAGAQVVKPQPVLLKLSQSGGMLDTRSCPGEIEFKVMER